MKDVDNCQEEAGEGRGDAALAEAVSYFEEAPAAPELPVHLPNLSPSHFPAGSYSVNRDEHHPDKAAHAYLKPCQMVGFCHINQISNNSHYRTVYVNLKSIAILLHHLRSSSY